MGIYFSPRGTRPCCARVLRLTMGMPRLHRRTSSPSLFGTPFQIGLCVENGTGIEQL